MNSGNIGCYLNRKNYGQISFVKNPLIELKSSMGNLNSDLDKLFEYVHKNACFIAQNNMKVEEEKSKKNNEKVYINVPSQTEEVYNNFQEIEKNISEKQERNEKNEKVESKLMTYQLMAINNLHEEIEETINDLSSEIQNLYKEISEIQDQINKISSNENKGNSKIKSIKLINNIK